MFESARELVDEYRDDPGLHDEDSRRTLEGLDFAARQYRKFIQGAGETKRSVIMSLGVRLSPLEVGRCPSHPLRGHHPSRSHQTAQNRRIPRAA